MCADPLVTLFAIIGVGFVVTTLLGMAAKFVSATLDWWYGEELEN